MDFESKVIKDTSVNEKTDFMTFECARIARYTSMIRNKPF